MGEAVLDEYRQAARHIRPLLAVHLVLRLVGVALLAPVAVLAIAEAMHATGRTGITDKDIVWFFYLLPGTLTLFAIGALAVLAAVLDVALMSVVLAAGETRASGAVALALGTLLKMPGRVIGVCGGLALRLIWGALPYVLGLLLLRWIGLRRHEMDYYLVTWPPEFLLALLIGAALAVGLVRKAIRCLSQNGIALHLALSRQTTVRESFAASGRSLDHMQSALRRQIAFWAGVKLILAFVLTGDMAVLTGTLPGLFGADLRLAAKMVAGLLLLWAVLAAVVAALSNGALAGLLLKAWERAGGDPLPQDGIGTRTGVTLLLGAGLACAVSAAMAPRLIPTFVQTPEIQIIARPADGIAGIRAAMASEADWILIGLRADSSGAIALASGGQDGPADLRDVLELADAAQAPLLFDLEADGDGAGLVAQLAELVDETGTGGQVAVMSSSIEVLNRMRLLRPGWRSGALVLWPRGDFSGLDVDFLAPNSGQVTMKRVWRAKSAGKEVYAWPADRTLAITRVIEQGVNGIITADPSFARHVAEAHNHLPLADRLLLWLAGRLNLNSLRLAEPGSTD